jgi:hypothetical protein
MRGTVIIEIELCYHLSRLWFWERNFLKLKRKSSLLRVKTSVNIINAYSIFSPKLLKTTQHQKNTLKRQNQTWSVRSRQLGPVIIYTQKNIYSIYIRLKRKFLEHELFFKAILILEQFYKAKKKKGTSTKFFKQFFDFCFWRFFLSIKTPHMPEYILA